MVVDIGSDCCDAMALSGVRRVVSTVLARNIRVPLNYCINVFPS